MTCRHLFNQSGNGNASFRFGFFPGVWSFNAIVTFKMNKGRGGRRWRAAPPRPGAHRNRTGGFAIRLELVNPHGTALVWEIFRV
jgi:hypothetical protein